METIKTVTMLVGQIASGKSSLCDKDKDSTVISKDDLRYEFATLVNKAYLYDELLEQNIDTLFKNSFKIMLSLGIDNLIIDETNMTKEGRRYYINKAKEFGYKVKAIVFPDLGEDTHVKRRLNNNHGDTSEETWREVYREKKARYEEPTKEEGFDEVIFYNT